jgi:hypothetical protein
MRERTRACTSIGPGWRLARDPVYALGDELDFERGCRTDGDALRERVHADDVRALCAAADVEAAPLSDREAVVRVVRRRRCRPCRRSRRGLARRNADSRSTIFA